MELAARGVEEAQGRSPQAAQAQRRAMLAGKEKFSSKASRVSTRVPSEHGTLASLSTLGPRNTDRAQASRTRPARDAGQSAAELEPEADELLEDVDGFDQDPLADHFDPADGSVSERSSADVQRPVVSAATALFLQMMGPDSDDEDDRCRGGFCSFAPAKLALDFSDDGSLDEFAGGSVAPEFKAMLEEVTDELPMAFAVPTEIKIRSISFDALPALGEKRPQSAPSAATEKILTPEQAKEALSGGRVPTPPMPSARPRFQRAHRSVVKCPESQQPAADDAAGAGGGAAAHGEQEDEHNVNNSIAGAPGQALLRWRRRS